MLLTLLPTPRIKKAILTTSAMYFNFLDFGLLNEKWGRAGGGGLLSFYLNKNCEQL